jgi:hypothetical protein
MCIGLPTTAVAGTATVAEETAADATDGAAVGRAAASGALEAPAAACCTGFVSAV